MCGRERELCRAASGAEVCPLHPSGGYLGKQQRKIPLLEPGNFGFVFFFFFSFYKGSVKLLLSLPLPALRSRL